MKNNDNKSSMGTALKERRKLTSKQIAAFVIVVIVLLGILFFILKFGTEIINSRFSTTYSLEAGSRVPFGHYIQSSEKGAAKEDIMWIVLKEGDGQVWLLSEKCLDGRPYGGSEDKKWYESALCQWLNRDADNSRTESGFYSEAFSDEEKAVIVAKPLEDEKDTKTAWVFILSEKEVKTDFHIADNILAAVPTEYAKEIKEVRMGDDDPTCCWWWTRSNSVEAIFVDSKGNTYKNTYRVDASDINIGVRPSIWVKSEYFAKPRVEFPDYWWGNLIRGFVEFSDSLKELYAFLGLPWFLFLLIVAILLVVFIISKCWHLVIGPILTYILTILHSSVNNPEQRSAGQQQHGSTNLAESETVQQESDISSGKSFSEKESEKERDTFSSKVNNLKTTASSLRKEFIRKIRGDGK